MFQYTLCEAAESLRKIITLRKDGTLEKQPTQFPYEFYAYKQEGDFKDLASVLSSPKPTQFLIHGTYARCKVEQKVRVVTKKEKEDKYEKNAKIIARSEKYFRFQPDRPCLFMIDVDEGGYEHEEIHEMLCDLHPPFKGAGYIAAPSSSSAIRRGKTGEFLSDTKWHLYFAASRGADLERFARILFEKAIAKGYGRAFIAKDGKQHIRTFFDLSVIQASRVDFIAPPALKTPLTQVRPKPTVHDGGLLDVSSLIRLSNRLKKDYTSRADQILEDSAAEAAIVRSEYKERFVKDYMKRTGKPREEAVQVVNARLVDEEEVHLHIDDLIIFEDGSKESVYVRDIIADPESYINRSVKDPLEPDYGENKAKIFLSGTRLLINSFVHGGRKFILSGVTNRAHFKAEDHVQLLGFLLDESAIQGGWVELFQKHWARINDGGRVKFVRMQTDLNRYIPIPEEGVSLSSAFSRDQLLMFDTRNFQDALPHVYVCTGWDQKKNRPKQELLAKAVIEHGNIPLKAGGIDIYPPEQEDPTTFNRWTGFPVQPVRGQVHKVINTFFEEWLEYEDDDIYEYFWSYIYHLFQHPFEKPGVAILFESTQGTGKGTFIQMLSSLLGPNNSCYLDRMESLTGRFNSIIAGKVLVYADEIMFGGYRAANNVLKKIITEEYLTVEAKFQAPRAITNVSRLFFSTNESWGLHIERSDRRIFVPTVSTKFQRNTEFFQELRFQWNRHYDKVLHRFMTMNINVDIKSPPMTQGKADLIDISMDTTEEFLKDALSSGQIQNPSDFGDDKPIVINRESRTEIPVPVFYQAYVAYAHRAGGQSARQEIQKPNLFWKRVYSAFGKKSNSSLIQVVGRRGTDKHRVILPPLLELRQAWDKSHNSYDFRPISAPSNVFDMAKYRS